MDNSRYKFRAWDTRFKKWVFGETVWISSNGMVYRDADPHGADMSGKVRIYPTDEVEIVRFTGKKDSEGVEMYEGDVVEQVAKMDYPGEHGGEIDRLYIGEVIIVPSKGTCLRNPRVIDRLEDDKSWYCFYYVNVASYRSRIIGNKFEHPELLEGK